MSTDTFDITKLSRALIGKKKMLFDNSTHTLDLFCLMQFIKDNGVFVKQLIENALKKMRKHFLALLTMHFQS